MSPRRRRRVSLGDCTEAWYLEQLALKMSVGVTSRTISPVGDGEVSIGDTNVSEAGLARCD